MRTIIVDSRRPCQPTIIPDIDPARHRYASRLLEVLANGVAIGAITQEQARAQYNQWVEGGGQ